MWSSYERKRNTPAIRLNFCAILISQVLLLTAFVGAEVKPAEVKHYRITSTIEYAGQGQFRNQLDTFLTARKQFLSDEKTHYVISIDNPGPGAGNQNSGRSLFKEVSFDIENGRLAAGANQDVAFFGEISNLCAKSLQRVTRQDVGKTWNRSFDLSLSGNSSVHKLNFTMTAMAEKKGPFGEMIAVRAMSEPFTTTVAVENGVSGTVTSRINTVYLFDSAMQDVYLSISVFEAATNINGFKEIFRNEVAIYKTDASLTPVDLSGISGNFEKFAGKLGLSGEALKISSRTELPQWVKSEGIRNVQVANICSAIACEGALNPVSSLSIPAAAVLEFQKKSDLKLYTADAKLAAKEAAPNIFRQITSNWGWNMPTAAVVGGGVAGGIAVGGGFGGGGGGSSTPASP